MIDQSEMGVDRSPVRAALRMPADLPAARAQTSANSLAMAFAGR